MGMSSRIAPELYSLAVALCVGADFSRWGMFPYSYESSARPERFSLVGLTA
jgi:hypothetical protein